MSLALIIRDGGTKYVPTRPSARPHDEAFKKLLQTFFAEFFDLFFPDLNARLDHEHTRFLMQELLVDVVGGEARELDLLLETRYKEHDAYILIHLEPQSYWEADYQERMFIYFSRLFERYRKQHKLIIPIAIFTYDDKRDAPDTLSMGIPGHDILTFKYLTVELKKQNWRNFIESDNPMAAALLVKMGYNKSENKQLRTAFLRMILMLRRRNLDDAKIALIMSFADVYFETSEEEDDAIMAELSKEFPKEGAELMELMPAWKRWGYEEGLEQGIEQGKREVALNLIKNGFPIEQVAKAANLPIEEVRKLAKHE